MGSGFGVGNGVEMVTQQIHVALTGKLELTRELKSVQRFVKYAIPVFYKKSFLFHVRYCPYNMVYKIGIC